MEHMDHMEEILRGVPLFRAFSRETLRELIAKSHLRGFAPGEVIITFGQPGRFLGVILRGTAEVLATGKGGERYRIGLLRKNDFLGEMSLLTGEPTSADVVALEACELLLIPQEIFSTFVAVNPEAVKILARTLTERMRRRDQDETAKERLQDAWRNAPDPYGLALSTPTPMKILVINCGSSSLKYSYFHTTQEMENLEGMVERIGLEGSRIVHSSKKGKIAKDLGSLNHAEALQAVLEQLKDPEAGVLRELDELTAVGHRVVHGGHRYQGACIIDEEVMRHIEENSVLAPLHNPLNLMAIRESMRLMPKVPQVAVFDTGFHQKMPLQACLYALPYELYEKEGIRRYGFHGISHHYVALRAAAHLRRDFRGMRIVTCHLGNGASVCAIDHGRSVDTSMGFTPLEGLVMGTRCGDLDPSVVLHLMRVKGLSADDVDDMLNRRSGLKGISGISSDFREIEEAANRGDHRSVLAIQLFCYRVRKYIGAYISAMGGLEALVFTGGIGEGSAWVRSLVCQGLSSMGIVLDDLLNRTLRPASGEVAEISEERSWVKVLVIPTDEARMIARETIRALGYEDVAKVIKSQEARRIPIEVSAHHVHLSRREVDALFGRGYQLTARSELSQPGQFACAETVDLVGPRGKVEKVRILGPVRDKAQVEISMTEEFKLGIKAPIRASGDLDGSPGVTLMGPLGSCELSEGVICSLRHIHMSPGDALSLGLKDRDVCMVRVEGERTLTFGDVLVRVSPDFRLSMHIDTDEANAAGISAGMVGYLVGVQDRK